MKHLAICLAYTLGTFSHARGRNGHIEVTGWRPHSKQLCGGMEIPRRLVFSCASKVQLNHLKELLENKNPK